MMWLNNDCCCGNVAFTAATIFRRSSDGGTSPSTRKSSSACSRGSATSDRNPGITLRGSLISGIVSSGPASCRLVSVFRTPDGHKVSEGARRCKSPRGTDGPGVAERGSGRKEGGHPTFRAFPPSNDWPWSTRSATHGDRNRRHGIGRDVIDTVGCRPYTVRQLLLLFL